MSLGAFAVLSGRAAGDVLEFDIETRFGIEPGCVSDVQHGLLGSRTQEFAGFAYAIVVYGAVEVYAQAIVQEFG